MRAIRIRIPHTLHNSQHAFIEQFLETIHFRMQPQLIIQLQHFALSKTQARAQAMVCVIAKRDHGVQSVIAPGQLHQHENAPVRIGRGCLGRVRKERLRTCSKGNQTCGAGGAHLFQKSAS